MINNNFMLIHDAKQRDTFLLARWSKDYSSTLCWVSLLASHPQPVSHIVPDNFPHRQHSPSLIPVWLQLPIIRSSIKRHWNFHKADGKKFCHPLERSVITIPSHCIPLDEAYHQFQGVIYKATRLAIPQGCQPIYTPCLSAHYQALLRKFELSGTRTLQAI